MVVDQGEGDHLRSVQDLGPVQDWRNMMDFCQLLFPMTPVTRLLIRRAHEVGHGGQDRTLLELRFWTVRGGRMAKAMSV